MKTSIRHIPAMLMLLALPVLNHPLSTASAQGTAFTYQGQLQSGGRPANGSYDLVFTLETNSITGVPLAGPVTNSAVSVTNGLFTTVVDFGAAFTGTSNWLEIAVSTNGANLFFTLAPRQRVTPVPYAITAENVAGTLPLNQLPAGVALLNGGNNFTGNQTFNGGNIGVGTGSPFTQLANTPNNIYGTDGYGVGFKSLAWSSDGYGYTAGFFDPYTGSLANGVVIGIAGTAGRILDLNAAGNSVMVVNGGGNVGIGTDSPSLPLTVMADDTGYVDAKQVLIQTKSDPNKQLELGYGVNGNYGSIQAYQQQTGPRPLALQPAGGAVGIGTTTPASALQVIGNIRLGSGGANYAASGTENLRIVRGIVNSAGTAIAGSGFTSAHNGSTGSYTLTFSPAFGGSPAVTASGVNTLVNVGGMISSSAITVQTINPGGAAQDGSFSFIAIGPQ
jgi:hypothetical protein